MGFYETFPKKVDENIAGWNARAYACGLAINNRYKTGIRIYNFRMALIRGFNLAMDLAVVMSAWILFGYGFLRNSWPALGLGFLTGLHGTVCMFHFMRDR